jgi:hypothetical protein
VGVGPKWVIDRCRLYETVAQLQAGAEVARAEPALAPGYCDQAHFARDFRRLAGLSPTPGARRRSPGMSIPGRVVRLDHEGRHHAGHRENEMRCMVLLRATRESEAGKLPDERLLADMMKFNEELAQAGVLLAGEGLKPSSAGARVKLDGDRRTVVDGPFAETRELVAGFWLWQVRSLDEAIAWARRCPPPFEGEAEIDIRPLYEMDDFGSEATPELRQAEQRLRDELAAKST